MSAVQGASVGVVPFVDLGAQHRSVADEVRAALDDVLERGDFILGEAVTRFEEEFAAFVGARHAVGVGTGLDALRLALVALGIGPGDEVVLPANTFIATALAVSALGASPVLVDCLEDTHQIDPDRIGPVVTARTRALIPVHLYGHPVDMDRVGALARTHGLAVVEDAAQAHGARIGAHRCGAMGEAGCFSFYPAKNLGAYGDGGMVVTSDEGLADHLRHLRSYGQAGKNEHVELGGNSRLDSIQAAVLRVKLRRLDQWNRRRIEIAALYGRLLRATDLVLPMVQEGAEAVFHLYVVRSTRRDALRDHLEAAGIRTGVHYPTPVHLQPAYARLGQGPGSFPVAERLAGQVLSLPIFPEMSDAQVEAVAAAVRSFA